jgi:hypothetical protein
LEIKLAFPIRLLLASPSAVEKNCHGSMAAKTSKAYGTEPGAGSLATLLKMNVKTSMVRKGRTSAQAMPIAVCL